MNTDSNIPGQAPPPAGWYPDGSGGLRWWNGIEWTADTQPAPQQQPQFQQQPFPAQIAPTPPQKRSRKGLVITLIAAAAVVVIGGVIGTGLLLNSLLGPMPSGSNVNPGLTETPEPETSTGAPSTPTQEPKDTTKPSETPKFTDVLAERDQFIKDQKLPLDGSVLTPITEPQKQFIEELRRQYANLGLTLGDQDVSVSLALSADACETSILNSHQVTELTARTHASTSPLIAALLKNIDADKRQVATNGLMKNAVLGVNYMCPADHAQWTTAFNAVNGSW